MECVTIDSYICYCDVNSSVSSGEQMQDTLGKIYSESEEMLDVSLSESELLDFTNTPYERFVTEDDACSKLLATMKTTRTLNWN